jgi:hypothetical protein
MFFVLSFCHLCTSVLIHTSVSFVRPSLSDLSFLFLFWLFLLESSYYTMDIQLRCVPGDSVTTQRDQRDKSFKILR